MNGVSILQKVFSRATTATLFLVLLALLGASFVTYLQDRHLQSISLGSLRMASWNLAQLRGEASAFDREMALAKVGVGDPEELALRYDILWSRYDYLLHSTESLPTRQHQDNEERLWAQFDRLKAMEASILTLTEKPQQAAAALEEQWAAQRSAIEQLVIDNFIGDETGQLMKSVEASRDRLSTLRLITFTALVAVFVYLGVAMVYLRHQARRDPVTGLANTHYLETLQGVDPQWVVAAIEIRRFQVTLSDLGTDAANDLTRQFASVLQGWLSADDTLVQISQSQFLVLADMSADPDIERWARSLRSATSFQCNLEDTVLGVTGILGIDPPAPIGETDWQVRYQKAHRALIQARMDGCDYHINGEDLRRRMREERILQQGLVRFLASGRGPLALHLVYQPMVRTPDHNRIVGMEVLLRCHEQSLGPVPPNRVVDICERYGLGQQLGRWIFSAVAAEASSLYQQGGFLGSLSINLNPSMMVPDLVGDVRRLLLEQGIPATCLFMEITEDNAALDFQRINHLIDQLHQLGVRFALDDFGTGHSSLEYVRELKVDRLKIDRCFVNGIESNDDRRRFLESIVGMASQAYMKCVIEGVENQAQWDLVTELDEVLVQGYYSYRPMSFDHLSSLLGVHEPGKNAMG